MFTLKKEFRFEAAHKLPSHDGKCARLHGHSWRMVIVVQGQALQGNGSKAGMLVDYTEISDVVKPLVESKLDHHYLNESTGLENPTSEILARWMFDEIFDKLPGLVAVQIDETCTSSCIYQK